jgi:cytochrome c-type biogenesis protein CcmE
MTDTTRNRLILVGALLVAGAGLAFVAYGKMGENLVYYWTPSEMMAQGRKAYGPTIRLGGVVQEKSVEWNAQHTSLKFRVADSKEPNAPSVLVTSSEIPPQMFREGIGVVVEGTLDKSQVFQTNRLMVNHSNEYKPPGEGDDHKDWKNTMQESTTTAATKQGP